MKKSMRRIVFSVILLLLGSMSIYKEAYAEGISDVYEYDPSAPIQPIRNIDPKEFSVSTKLKRKYNETKEVIQQLKNYSIADGTQEALREIWESTKKEDNGEPKSAFDQAKEEFLEYELSDPDSTLHEQVEDLERDLKYLAIIKSTASFPGQTIVWLQKEILDRIKNQSSGEKEYTITLPERGCGYSHSTWQAVQDLLWVYDIFSGGEELRENVIGEDLGEKLDDMTDKNFDKDDVENIFSSFVDHSLGYVRDFTNTPSFGKWLSSYDPEWLQATDDIFDIIYNNESWHRRRRQKLEDQGIKDPVPDNLNVRLPYGIKVLKPNIYIYSEDSRQICVEFETPERLLTTIPAYDACWEMQTGKNGKLFDSQGTCYDYLFYESASNPGLYQTEVGYRIPADVRSETFTKILTEMNFSKEEIADFLEFWDEKLDADKDYLMYPQGKDTVDLAMPVVITDQPEHVERIWFAFQQDEGQSVETPEVYRMDRTYSYYVVEWGGMILSR